MNTNITSYLHANCLLTTTPSLIDEHMSVLCSAEQDELILTSKSRQENEKTFFFFFFDQTVPPGAS